MRRDKGMVLRKEGGRRGKGRERGEEKGRGREVTGTWT